VGMGWVYNSTKGAYNKKDGVERGRIQKGSVIKSITRGEVSTKIGITNENSKLPGTSPRI